MRNFILSILFIFFALSVNAQRVRFTNKTNIWKTATVTNDGTPGSLSYTYSSTDTLIHGNWYQNLAPTGTWLYFGGCGVSSFPGSSGYVREDTTAQKVYYFSITDSSEHVLYDYNMHIGDTIHFSMPFATTDTVISMDSVLYNGYYYKIFNMIGGASTNRNYTVLEGVGCTNNPVLPTYWGGCFEGGESLVCFYEGGIKPALHAPLGCYAYSSYCPVFIGAGSFDNAAVCGSLLSVNQSHLHNPPISISPNPAFDHIDIIFNQRYDNAKISVYDMTGKCILKPDANKADNTTTINTSSWPNGLYMVIVQDNTGIVKKEKVVVQH